MKLGRKKDEDKISKGKADLYYLGLGRRQRNELFDILADHSINVVVDIRNKTTSGINAFSYDSQDTKRDDMAGLLQDRDIAYFHLKCLTHRVVTKEYRPPSHIIQETLSSLFRGAGITVCILGETMDPEGSHAKDVIKLMDNQGMKVEVIGRPLNKDSPASDAEAQ